ncbi:hypothetical protein [Alcaligenes aquatilis]|uniref:hypothetical protein n=1 Tax=Alcaligenes aquatilis TaxID=323284 RepID=UPI00361465FA
MSQNLQLELQKMLGEMHQKYTYFLLTAVGAAIGFTITQTSKHPLSLWFLPLAVSLLSWGVSFVMGCLYLQLRALLGDLNFKLITIQNGEDEVYGRDPIAVTEAVFRLKKKFNDKNNTVGFYYRWQFYFFVVGVIFFIFWHILEMWRRIPEHMCLWV